MKPVMDTGNWLQQGTNMARHRPAQASPMYPTMWHMHGAFLVDGGKTDQEVTDWSILRTPAVIERSPCLGHLHLKPNCQIPRYLYPRIHANKRDAENLHTPRRSQNWLTWRLRVTHDRHIASPVKYSHSLVWESRRDARTEILGACSQSPRSRLAT